MIATTIMNNNNYKKKMLELLVPTKYKMIPKKPDRNHYIRKADRWALNKMLIFCIRGPEIFLCEWGSGIEALWIDKNL